MLMRDFGEEIQIHRSRTVENGMDNSRGPLTI